MSKRPASSTRKYAPDYKGVPRPIKEPLRDKRGERAVGPRVSSARPGETSLQVEFGAPRYRGRDVTADGTTVDGPWIPPQIGCGHLEGN